MEFEKKVVFLGFKDMKLRDGTVLYSISLFVDGESVTVNVLASNEPVVSAVKALAFGDNAVATFILRKSDKLYRLSLSGIA